MRSLFRFTKEIFQKIRRSLELRKYNSYTIAEYFRKQGAQIGEGCSIIPTFLGTEPYLVKIGNHVTIANGVTFITHDGGAWIVREEYPDAQVFGPIVIEDNCVIGQNAILFPNIRIGSNSIVGAGSVVISDVPPNTIALGVPARPFGSVEKYKQKCLERWNVQQPADCLVESGKDWWSSRHFLQNRKKLRRHLLNVFQEELGPNRAERKEVD
jgi:acetyltransferase-like isoleucine patch superfamily enzyme